jgi:4-hydroxyphenylacetate 3-monooxygenase
LLAYARDLLNSDYAGHRLTFNLFAQSPGFAHLLAVYRNFDFDDAIAFVQRSAGLSERVLGPAQPAAASSNGRAGGERRADMQAATTGASS